VTGEAAGVVGYEVRDRVAWITLNRPGQRNAMNAQMRAELFDAFRRFNDDDGAAVMVITGAGNAFCAGGDLREFSDENLGLPPDDFVPELQRNIDVPKPTIAAVNGAAFAGGFMLAQTTDLCIAADTARFAISEAKVGRGAPWAATLPWLVPPRIALQLLMTAEPITAGRAYDVGLVNEVVPGDQLVDAAQAVAVRIADNAPLSVRAGKQMVHDAARHREHYRAAAALWERVYVSEDAQEGPRSFVERRPPRWQGR
jgi:enoyl-CoA hydratase/carnithine racemase